VSLLLLESYVSLQDTITFSFSQYTFCSKILIARRAAIDSENSLERKKSQNDSDERNFCITIASAHDCHRYSCDGITEADFQKTPLSSYPPLLLGPIQRQRDWATSGLDSGCVNLSPSHAPLPRDERGAAPLKKRKENSRSSSSLNRERCGTRY